MKEHKDNIQCIHCVIQGIKRIRNATHTVRNNGVELPLCSQHYEEFLAQEDLSIELIEANYGDYNTEC